MRQNYIAPELDQFQLVVEAGFAVSDEWDTQLPGFEEEVLP